MVDMMMTIVPKYPAPPLGIRQEEVCIIGIIFHSLLYYVSLSKCVGSARLYREPVSKTNRPIILNAVEYVVLPGEVRLTHLNKSVE